MAVSCDKALKEWAPVVDALGEGLQTVLIRKYPPSHDTFFLLPTYMFLQKSDYLQRCFQERHRELVERSIAFKSEKKNRVQVLASVTKSIRVEKHHIHRLGNLVDSYIWSPDHVLSFFGGDKVEAAHVWILRAKLLPKPVEVSISKRAITYVTLPTPISVSDAIPVLDDAVFRTKLADIEEKLRETVGKLPSHNEVRNMIHEIGRFEGRVSEVEYPIDGMRLDVAWKRIKTGIPSHAFEVQIGGDFFEALSKLKHAWDKWNSTPILVTTEEYEEKARLLLEGSFHEIQRVAKIVNVSRIVELHKLQREVHRIKAETGISNNPALIEQE